MWGTKRVDFHLNWPKWFGWEAGFGFWAMYVWANLLNRRHLSSAEQSSSQKEATADDSDNGASGYTDWDCIFHLHFKMQMSRRVVLWISFPSPSETSPPHHHRIQFQNVSMAQMRTNLYARTLWIRYPLVKWLNVSLAACSPHKCAQINYPYLSFYLGFHIKSSFATSESI